MMLCFVDMRFHDCGGAAASFSRADALLLIHCALACTSSACLFAEPLCVRILSLHECDDAPVKACAVESHVCGNVIARVR